MTEPPVSFAERLSVPLRWWVQGTMLVATLWLATVVALPGWASWLVTAVATATMAAVFLGYGGVRVEVLDGELRAGRAHIAISFLGEVTSLDAEATRRAAGVDADARAYLVLRPYVRSAVRVVVVDPDDPTPYWLVSSRRPDELARALVG